MIELYYFPTPNGHKITIFLEETKLDYRIKPIDILKGDQFYSEFLKISPNNKMPAIVDTEPEDGEGPLSLFESGAILRYLAQKTERFYPQGIREAWEVEQWLTWQVAHFGPMLGQNHHFNIYAPEQVPYAQERYTQETSRLYSVLNNRLRDRDFVAGSYSIADMAIYPWANGWERQKQDLSMFPYVADYLNLIGSRPAVKRAYEIGQQYRRVDAKQMKPEEWQTLFGNKMVKT
ncbi:MAG: glutathione S-transferase N-terminal domain-containing protein [SAR324 cluster bacterium]|nr:glutathione S-transferase N-terminal domain-containing protein [SAR324 cluster bacterium]